MNVFDLEAVITLNLDNFNHNLDTASKKFKSFSDNISGLSGKIDSAYKGVGDMLKPAVDGFQAVENVGKKAGNAITTGLKGFAAASTVVGGFGAAAVKSGMSFDSSMSKVQAISGATGDELQSLRDKALEMGSKTKFSASEAADAMTYMGMAGWKTEDMLGGIAGIMNLAAASGEDLASTSDIVTNALTAFGMKASESGHFADILAAASSNANTDVHMMGESFKYAAPVMGTLGYSAEDTAVALGLMGNAGIQASMAGTSLKTAMLNMASPTKNMAAVMSQYGISLTDTNGEMYSLGDVMAQLRDKMGGLDETTKAAAASTLFGKEAAAGMLAIINAAPEDFDKLTASINECNGAAEKMSSIMEDNLQGDITKLGSAFEALQIAISDSLTPTLREFAQFGQKAMAGLLEGFQGGGVSGFMSALSGIVTEGVTILAAKAPEFASVSLQFVGALGEGMINAAPQIFNSLYEVKSTLISGLRSFLDEHSNDLVDIGNGILNTILTGFLAGSRIISDYIGDFVPLIVRAFAEYHSTLFTAGMEILSAIGQGIVDNKELIRENMFQTVFEMVHALQENAPAIIEGGLALLEALVGAIEENMPLIIETGAVIIGKLVEGIATASPGVQAIIATAVLPHILKIVDTVGKIGGAVSNVAGLAGNAINTVINIGGKLAGGIKALWALLMTNPVGQVIAVVSLLVAAFVTLWNNCEAFRNFWIGLWEGIKSVASAAVEAIKATFDGIVDFFSGIVDGIKSVFEGIGEFLGGLFTAAWEVVKGVWEAAVDFFSGVWAGIQGVFSVVSDVLGGFFSAAWEAVTAIWSAAVNFFTEIGNGIQSVFEAVTGFLGDVFSAAWDVVSGVWEAATGFFGGIWDNIKGTASKAADFIGGALKKAWEAVKGAWNGAVSFFSGIAGNIINTFTSLPSKFLSIGGDIVNGLKNGIANAWNSFIGWLNDKVGGIVNGVKAMLGIHSPSTVFAGIGENMALGLAAGWDDQYSSIKRQIEGGMSFAPISVGITDTYSGARGGYGAQNAERTGGQFGAGGFTVNIYNPQKRDAVTEAREWKKTAQRMSMGYV